MKTRVLKIPDRCDICKDPIALYEPYYTIRIKSHLKGIPIFKSDVSVFCPACFRAYKDFLKEREVEVNHLNNYKEMKGANKNGHET